MKYRSNDQHLVISGTDRTIQQVQELLQTSGSSKSSFFQPSSIVDIMHIQGLTDLMVNLKHFLSHKISRSSQCWTEFPVNHSQCYSLLLSICCPEKPHPPGLKIIGQPYETSKDHIWIQTPYHHSANAYQPPTRYLTMTLYMTTYSPDEQRQQ